MANPKYEAKVNVLLTKDKIKESDFVAYIKELKDLNDSLEQGDLFHTFAPTVKNWICEFETIFNESKINKKTKTFWPKYMSKLCPSITMTYLSFLQSFHQFDPKYSQEFYLHWKSIISRMTPKKRGDSFISNIDQFKIVIDHLRMAEQRFEQFAILSLLKLYVESVPIQKLRKLKENDNVHIVDRLVQLMNNPTILNQHAFLHDIDALGHTIESMKPKRIICEKLKLHYDNTEHEMWLDLNKKEKTILFVTISPTDSDNQTLALGGGIKLRENVYDDHLLEINGIWNVITNGKDAIQKRVTVKVFLLNNVQSSISRLVKTTFQFVDPSHSGTSQAGPSETFKDHCNKTVDIYEDVASPEVTNQNRGRPMTCWYRFRSFRGAPRDWVLRLRFKKFKVGTLVNATYCEGGFLQSIATIIENQLQSGLRSITDGETRRGWFHFDFLKQLGGVEMKGMIKSSSRASDGISPPRIIVTGKLTYAKPIQVADFEFLNAQIKSRASKFGDGSTFATAKVCIPSPTMVHFRGGRANIDIDSYPDLDEFFVDLASVYQEELANLYEAGARFVQFDDTNLAYLCDEKMKKEVVVRNDDPSTLPRKYAQLINEAISKRPVDMKIGIHLCRGNYKSQWFATGGYEPVAKVLFQELNVDVYFLEYDDARSGDFAPLRFLPENKIVVMGLMSSKKSSLDDRGTIIRRLNEAAAICSKGLDQLCLSHQCGFSSTQEGNDLTEEEQWEKMKLAVNIAKEVWGEDLSK